MDGDNNGKPYFLMDDLGVPLFLETPIIAFSSLSASALNLHCETRSLISSFSLRLGCGILDSQTRKNVWYTVYLYLNLGSLGDKCN